MDVLSRDPDIVYSSLGPEVEGNVTLTVESERIPRTTAISRIVSSMRLAGVDVLELMGLDTITQVSEAWLDTQLAGWAGPGPSPAGSEQRSMYRRRLEALAGATALEQVLARCRDGRRSWDERLAAARACPYVLLNTPELSLAVRALDTAADVAQQVPSRPAFPRGHAAVYLVEAVAAMFRPWQLAPAGHDDASALAGAEAILRRLLSHPWGELQWRSCELAAVLPGTREPATGEILARLAVARVDKKGRDAGVLNTAVASALARCRPTPVVLAALEALMEADQAETRLEAATALGTLGGPDAARRIWTSWLRSRSEPERDVARELLAHFGAAEDVDDAVAALRVLLRSSARPGWPRGTALIEFLTQLGARSQVAAELERARARAAGLDPSLEEWLAGTMPDLAACPGG